MVEPVEGSRRFIDVAVINDTAALPKKRISEIRSLRQQTTYTLRSTIS